MATYNTRSGKKAVEAALTVPKSSAVTADAAVKQTLRETARKLDNTIQSKLEVVAESKKTLTTGKQPNQNTPDITALGIRHGGR